MGITTRSKSGAAPKQADADVALHKTFSGQSLLAWASGSSKKKSGIVRKSQTNAPILNLPLDLLAIIFSLCHPLDLLQICRTCHNFKAFFLSEASLPIWHAGRKAVSFTITEEEAKMVPEWDDPKPQTGAFQLPHCPVWFSEPAYAAFICEPKCMYCNLEDETLRYRAIRICRDCRQSTSFVAMKTLKADWKQDADPRLYTMLPNIAEEYSSRKPKANDRVFHQPTCKAIFDRAFRYEVEVKFNVRMVNAFFAKGEQEMKERRAFRKAYAAFIAAEINFGHIARCKRDREREELFKDNKQFVVMRLGIEGIESFETDIDDSLHASQLIRRQEREMDDAIYATIKSELIEYLKPVQEQRRYMTAYYDPENTRIRGFMDEHLFALLDLDALAIPIRLADFIELPICRKLSDDQAFINGSESDRQTIWDANLENVHTDIAAWITAREQEIVGVVQDSTAFASSNGDLPEQANDIVLSSEVLREPFVQLLCEECGLASHVSEMLVHDCFAAYPSYNLHHTRGRLQETGNNTHVVLQSPLDIKKALLTIDWESTLIGKAIYNAIVKVGGEPPKTIAAMQNKKGTLRCLQCAEGSAEREGTAVSSSYKSHCGAYGYQIPKLHDSFTYVLPEGGLAADINDDAPTPPQCTGWGDPFEYDSDQSFDSYLDYMHGGMMGDIDADMMMDSLMDGDLSDGW